MANAVVIAGHIRTFRNIANHLVAFIKKNKLDVYLYIWDENNNDEVQFVVDTLKPVKWLVEKNENYLQQFLDSEARVLAANPKSLITPDNVHAMFSMHFGRRKVFELIEKEYDNLIFTRFDTYIDPFSIEEVVAKNPNVVITPEKEYYGMVSDIFAIIPWKYADNYFFYSRAEDIHSRRFSDDFKEWLKTKFWWPHGLNDMRLHDENRYCPHMLCMRNFFETNTPYIVTDLPVYLQR